MKLNELRKGNLICPINRGGYIHLPMTLIVLKVLTIGIFDVEALPIDKNPVQEENWLKIKSSDISEIPLTKEWLLKFGFVYVGEFDEYRYKDETNWFGICDDYDLNGTKFYFFERQNMSTVVIESVHQLQNLYFALTREELQIIP